MPFHSALLYQRLLEGLLDGINIKLNYRLDAELSKILCCISMLQAGKRWIILAIGKLFHFPSVFNSSFLLAASSLFGLTIYSHYCN